MIDVDARLRELAALGLERSTRLIAGPQGPRVLLDGRPVILLCSNSYLGLADHPRVRAAALHAGSCYGVGAGASRLVSGTMAIHRALEQRLAAFEAREAALLLGSGYLANIGVIPALARAGEVVFSDELNHASIVDGCRLSRAEVFVYRHRDVEHLEWGLERAAARGALIVTDAVFSMDGDVAPLQEIVALAERFGVRTVVDEAHGTGTLGPGGRGAAAAAGVADRVDVIVGTLSKALGSYGAYVACEASMARYLTNAARPFIFSTAPPPPAVGAALEALTLLESSPELPRALARNAIALRQELAAHGFTVGEGETPIVPLIVGEPALATRICEAAIGRGVFAQAIRPPTVPDGTARLRLAVMATHSLAELRDGAAALAAAVREAGVDPRAITTVAPPAPPAVPGERASDRIEIRDERPRLRARR